MASPLVTSLDNLLLPRVTTTERNALTPVNGMLVYDTTLNAFYKYENGAWSNFAGLGYTAENAANKGAANGYASLGSDTKVPYNQLPVVAFATMFSSGPFATLSAGATQYGVYVGIGSLNATETLRRYPVTDNGTFSTCRVEVGNQPASGSLVITLRVNGSAPVGGPVITVPAGSSAGVYLGTGSIDVVAGDRVSWRFVNNASGATGQISGISIKFIFT